MARTRRTPPAGGSKTPDQSAETPAADTPQASAPGPMPAPHVFARSDAVLDAGDREVGQPRDGQIVLDGDAAIDRDEIQIVDGPAAMAYAEEIAFMEELVEIVVHPSSDKNAENPVKVAVNGRNQFIFRGKKQTVKRKFVERLARAKPESFVQPGLGNDDPQVHNRLVSTTALAYPFSILRDSNPRGADWLDKVLSEGQ